MVRTSVSTWLWLQSCAAAAEGVEQEHGAAMPWRLRRGGELQAVWQVGDAGEHGKDGGVDDWVKEEPLKQGVDVAGNLTLEEKKAKTRV